MSINRILNRTERVLCFPPVTVWPAEAKSVRHPGDSVSQMQMPDGTLATPAAVYPAVSAWPGVTTHNKDGRPCLPELDGAEAIADTNPQAYWDIVLPKCQTLISQGYVEFLGDGETSPHEATLASLTAKATSSKVELKGKTDAVAIQFVDLENDKNVLKGWLANESRPKVKKAIENRIKNV